MLVWPRPGAGDRAHERSAPTMAASVIVGDYGDGSIQKNGGIGRGPHNATVGLGSGFGEAIGERIDEVDDGGHGWGRRPMATAQDAPA